eukprot:461433-Prymnesium_polylepis.1
MAPRKAAARGSATLANKSQKINLRPRAEVRLCLACRSKINLRTTGNRAVATDWQSSGDTACRYSVQLYSALRKQDL